jgi:nicotinamide-nucleotide amidase
MLCIMRAAILSIGDEVTLGQNLDTNSAQLAAELAVCSIFTGEHRSVTDDRDAIARALSDLTRDVDIVICTGGLGPTDDDLTREALGDVLDPGKELVLDETALQWLMDRFAMRHRAMPENNRRQAMRPESARCLHNPHGTAPGLAGKRDGCFIFALPGPPNEMLPMFHDHVLPALIQDTPSDVMVSRMVHAFGLGESDAAALLGDLTDRQRNPLIGTTVSDSVVTARLRARGSHEQMQMHLQADMQRVEQCWYPYAYGRDGETLATAVGQLLLKAGRTLVTAESCTGGWLGKKLVDVAGSSAYYRGGWVTYSNEMKTSCLGVDAELLDQHGAVSPQVADAMSRGALIHQPDADDALAITGIAGPEGGSEVKPVGTVFIALAQLRDQQMQVHVRRFHFPGDRSMVRLRSARAAMQMLRFSLLGIDEQTPLLWQVPLDGQLVKQS